MNRIGRDYMVPTADGAGGGHIKWRPERWGVRVTVVSYPVVTDHEVIPTPAQEVTVSIPWRNLAQMLVTRDDVR